MNALRLVHTLLLLWAAGTRAASCPKLQLMQNFSTDEFLGVWYMSQAEDNIFQTLKSCLASTFTRIGENKIQVDSEGLDSSGAPATTQSTMEIDPQNPAHMVTDFVPGVQPPFDIVDTDYTNYACVHSCISVVGFKTEFVFIYARNRTLDTKFVEHCRKLFESNGIDTAKLEDVPQKNCGERSEL
ncbi:apolipoprotein D-like [Penaeus japonicus]|uniref:apolipoprotein D-like n=1 Tax=Penaeus japonicus TaxID=27405 RepID=UPI001C716DF1|nr:apolipoprotein D-like [Penaeus japonicus]